MIGGEYIDGPSCPVCGHPMYLVAPSREGPAFNGVFAAECWECPRRAMEAEIDRNRRAFFGDGKGKKK